MTDAGRPPYATASNVIARSSKAWQPEAPRDLAGCDRRPEVDRAGAVEAQEAGAEPKPQRDVEIAPALGGVRLALEPAGVGVLFR